MFLAGFVNRAESWVKFSNEWQAALKEGRSIEYFKASEAEAARGQFRRWGRLDREVKLNQLASVVSKSAPWSFHVAIDLDCFDRCLNRDGIPWGFRSPYWMAFEAIIVKVAQRHKEIGLNDPVDFIFDEQNQIHRSVTSLFECLRAGQPEEIQPLLGSTLIFRSDKEIVALQAADMLAWHVQRESRNGDLTPKRRITDKLIGDGRHSYVILDRDVLEDLSENIYQVGRFSSVSTKSEWRRILDIIDAETRSIRYGVYFSRIFFTTRLIACSSVSSASVGFSSPASIISCTAFSNLAD